MINAGYTRMGHKNHKELRLGSNFEFKMSTHVAHQTGLAHGMCTTCIRSGDGRYCKCIHG